jgi:hypothetical protein
MLFRLLIRQWCPAWQPGFTSGAAPYRFIASGGGVYEYTLENAADNDITTLEARQQRLAKELLTR